MRLVSLSVSAAKTLQSLTTTASFVKSVPRSYEASKMLDRIELLPATFKRISCSAEIWYESSRVHTRAKKRPSNVSVGHSCFFSLKLELNMLVSLSFELEAVHKLERSTRIAAVQSMQEQVRLALLDPKQVPVPSVDEAVSLFRSNIMETLALYSLNYF